MYKHLVVAVDGSETSINALKHAAELAGVNGARLTLVHVANPAEYMALAPEFCNTKVTRPPPSRKATRFWMPPSAPPGNWVWEIPSNTCWLPIRVRAKWRRIWSIMPMKTVLSMLVLGTHGRTGLMHL